MNHATYPAHIEIPAAESLIHAIIEIPDDAQAMVVFAHGLDSSNLSPRNRVVARSLVQRGFAILQPDLSTPAPDSGANPPDTIRLTASRLVAIIDWLAGNPRTAALRIGLFGARTGAAAAMIAAALRPDNVHAIVSRGGRPDLAEELLSDVQAPTLMLVGSNDADVIDHNLRAGEIMRRKPLLELIHGANHLFGEPGKLEQVASISSLWFQRTLAWCG